MAELAAAPTEAENLGRLSELHGRPYLRELRCDPADDSLTAAVATAIVPELLAGGGGGGGTGEPEVHHVAGGITNQLKRVTNPATNLSVLVRTFGAEGMIDRDIETPTFEALSAWLERPAYLGRFANGRVEEWLTGYRPLALGDMAQPHINTKLAAVVAKLHRFQVPPHLQPHHRPNEGGIWKTLRDWFEQATAPGSVDTIPGRSARDRQLLEQRPDVFDRGVLEHALDALAESPLAAASPLVFCHNDLLAGNIMMHETTGDVRVIDLEYGSLNFAAFDIANHFNEWAGGTTDEVAVEGIPEYGRLPDEAARRRFAVAYLTAMHDGQAPDPTAEDALLAEIEFFLIVDNFYWGLWAVNQARTEGTAQFPFFLYAQQRLARGLVEGGFLPGPPPTGLVGEGS